MNKFKGKALSLVLSLALVISSFSAVPASAATRTVQGDLSLADKTDSFYFVNGEANANKVFESFGEAIGDPTLKTERHQNASEIRISDISHVSGDRLVKWYDGSESGKEKSISKDTTISDIDLRLRNASVSGEEKLKVMYTGTYTDDDDKEYNVKDTQDVTIRVYKLGEVVVGETGTADGAKGERDTDFAQKTVTHETANGETDSKNLVALRAGEGAGLDVAWTELKTIGENDKNKDKTEAFLKDEDKTNTDKYYYVLKSSSDNIQLGTASDFDTYTYKAGVVKQGRDEAKTYDYGTLPTATVDTVTVAKADQDNTKLTTKKAENDKVEGKDWTYSYVIDAKTTDAKDLTIADGIDVAGLKLDIGKHTIAISAKDSEGTAVPNSTITVNVTVAGTTALEANDSAKVAPVADDATNTKYTVERATNDTAASYVYKYSIDGAKDTTVSFDATSKKAEIVLPTAAEDGAKVIVSAYKADNLVGMTTVTAETDKHPNVGGDQPYVKASVKDKASTSTLTLSAVPTYFGKEDKDSDGKDYLTSTSTVKQKAKITKTIKVDDPAFTKLGKKSSSTYVYSSASLDSEAIDNNKAVKVDSFEVEFENGASVTVADKANVKEISGNVSKVSIDNATVGEISLDNKGTSDEIDISDAKVGNIDFDAKGYVKIDSPKASVGDIKDAMSVTITGGKVGSVKASDEVTIRPDDDDSAVTVGDIETKAVTIDTGDSKGVTTGTIKVTDDDSEINISGDNVSVKAFDFDYYGAELKLSDFNGTIPAPKNADIDVDGATISTDGSGDSVTVKGDADINSISIADDSTMTFDGKLNVASINGGSGTLVVGLGKMNVTSDASDVKVKLADAFKVGDTAYTADHDTIDADDLSNYGYTVKKVEGSKTDSFKIDSVKFTGLTVAPATAEIAKGMTQTFTASAYAPGTTIPEGYHVEYTLDGSDTVFEGVDNKNGTYTVKVVGFDSTFASENKAVLKAELVDADGATNDEYGTAEVNITALETPKVAFTSDTAVKAMKVGDSYRFRITSADGTQPKNFVVASNGATVTYRGNSGKDYFYDVKAVKEGSYGVYVAGTKLAVLNITNAFSIDTKTVSVNAGASYQFKVTGPSQPKFQVAGVGDIKLTSKSGNNYFFKVTVPSNLAKGGHGVYVNGVAMAVVTVK